MRVFYLATGVFDKGGISRYSRYQIQALRELLGAEQVHVFSRLGPAADDFEEPFAVQYHGNGYGRWGKVDFSWQVLRAAFDAQPTLIWSNHVSLLPLALGVQQLRAPLTIVTNAYGKELWGAGQWRNRLTLPRMSTVVSDCHFSAEFLHDHYKLPPATVRVIWDCVDIARFKPQPRATAWLEKLGVPQRAENRYILTLGRISSRALHKGYDLLLDVLGALREQPQIIALFAGDGDARPRLEQRVRDEGLSGRVFFTGSVPEAQLVDVYNLCDVFALVSDRGPDRGEGIPLTPLEAAACGKPIIVGNEDGSQEAVVDGVNGRIVSPRQPETYRQALLDILLHDEARQRMGAAARARIENEFSYQIFKDKTAQVLAQFDKGK